MPSSQTHRQFIAFLLILLLNLYLPLHINNKRCAHSKAILSELQSNLLKLTPYNSSVAQSTRFARLKRIRELSALLQTFKPCSLVTPTAIRRQLETSLIASNLDTALIGILAIVNPRYKIAIEIGGNSLSAAPLALFQDFRVIALSKTWRTYDASRAFYSKNVKLFESAPFGSGIAIEAGSMHKRLKDFIKQVNVVRADIVLNYAGDGEDMILMEEIDTLHPQVIVMKYADFLGTAMKGISNGNTGILPLTQYMDSMGYRMIWCLSTEPIAVFVTASSATILKTIPPRQCLRERRTSHQWMFDMEGLWDEGRDKGWKNFG